MTPKIQELKVIRTAVRKAIHQQAAARKPEAADRLLGAVARGAGVEIPLQASLEQILTGIEVCLLTEIVDFCRQVQVARQSCFPNRRRVRR